MTTAVCEFESAGLFYVDRKATPASENSTEVHKGHNRTPEQDFTIEPEHTVFIIDWDDTLLATSWLARRQLNLETAFIPPKESAELEALDAAVCSFLRKVIYLYGKVLIVTNAQQGWVELSSRKFLPDTYDLIFAPSSSSSCCSFSSSSSGFNNEISDHEAISSFSVDYLERTGVQPSPNKAISKNGRIEDSSLMELEFETNEAEQFKFEEGDSDNSRISVHSARYLFEQDFPNDPSAWKRKAFQKLLKTHISSDFFIPVDSAHVVPEQTPEILQEKPIVKSSAYIPCKMDVGDFDIDNLIEIKTDSFEIETDFDENDSFFSFDFRPTPRDEDDVENDFPENVFEESNFTKEQVNPNEIVDSAEGILCTAACNIISIGDCAHDCDSLRNVELELQNTFKKTVKLIEYPEISHLIKELEELELCLDKIVKAKSNVDLVVKKSFLL